MNLLSFNNRLRTTSQPSDVDFINGYQSALGDILSYLKNVTQYNPANRMIDSVPLLESIAETNTELMKKMKGLHELIQELRQ